MRITFDDQSFIEVQKQEDKFLIIIQARDHEAKTKKITNCVELTKEEFNQLFKNNE